jgi:hypothetical protein
VRRFFVKGSFLFINVAGVCQGFGCIIEKNPNKCSKKVAGGTLQMENPWHNGIVERAARVNLKG